MAVVESLALRRVKYKVTFLRGRKEASHIEISEIVLATNAQEALDAAFRIAEKARGHIERMERMD